MPSLAPTDQMATSQNAPTAPEERPAEGQGWPPREAAVSSFRKWEPTQALGTARVALAGRSGYPWRPVARSQRVSGTERSGEATFEVVLLYH